MAFKQFGENEECPKTRRAKYVITLQMGGLMMSGTITSWERYKMHYKWITAAESEEGFLHLEDVKIHPGNIRASFWRCRISDISGFCQGNRLV
jgi:hypothetical protein